MTESLIKIENFIQSCTFNGIDCNITSDFIQFINPVLGACFSYNSQATKNTIRSGPLYGLRILLNANFDEYMTSTDSGGMRIMIHEADVVPLPEVFGFNIQTSTSTSLAITYVNNY